MLEGTKQVHVNTHQLNETHRSKLRVSRVQAPSADSGKSCSSKGSVGDGGSAGFLGVLNGDRLCHGPSPTLLTVALLVLIIS